MSVRKSGIVSRRLVHCWPNRMPDTTAGERQDVNHLALPVDTLEEFDAAYERLQGQGVDIIERG
jgi:hypothetical protein